MSILPELIIWRLETGHNKWVKLIDDLLSCLGTSLAVRDKGVHDDIFDIELGDHRRDEPNVNEASIRINCQCITQKANDGEFEVILESAFLVAEYGL